MGHTYMRGKPADLSIFEKVIYRDVIIRKELVIQIENCLTANRFASTKTIAAFVAMDRHSLILQAHIQYLVKQSIINQFGSMEVMHTKHPFDLLGGKTSVKL